MCQNPWFREILIFGIEASCEISRKFLTSLRFFCNRAHVRSHRAPWEFGRKLDFRKDQLCGYICQKSSLNGSKFMIFVRFWYFVLELHVRSQENFSRVSDLFATELMWDPAEHLESLAENQNPKTSIICLYSPRIYTKCVNDHDFREILIFGIIFEEIFDGTRCSALEQCLIVVEFGLKSVSCAVCGRSTKFPAQTSPRCVFGFSWESTTVKSTEPMCSSGFSRKHWRRIRRTPGDLHGIFWAWSTPV